MTSSGIGTRWIVRNGYPKPGALRKASEKPDDGKKRPPALHVAAAVVDLDMKEQVGRLVKHLRQAQAKAKAATSPLERQKWEKTAYELNETIGAIRFGSVTGTDSSDLTGVG